MIRIPVSLTNNSYEVIIQPSIIKRVGDELLNMGIKIGKKILIVSNNDVAKYYAQNVIDSLERSGYKTKLQIIEAGEENKGLETVQEIYDMAKEFEIDRGSLILALGGGVVGDIAGFAAATWLRGIDIIQIPTTLLSMVDSSVGGKTGVNHPKGKNLIGAFHQPKKVLIDPNTLETLPSRELKAGLAEVIKYGVIKDKNLFELLEKEQNINDILDLKTNILIDIIKMSVESKAHIVSIDEKENGIRAILNYGHTIGHVIENICGYGKYIHGEAIAIGMKVVGDLAANKQLWTTKEAERQTSLIKRYGLPTETPKMNKLEILNILKSDKKVRDGKLRFVLPTKIGKVDIFENITEDEILDFL